MIASPREAREVKAVIKKMDVRDHVKTAAFLFVEKYEHTMKENVSGAVFNEFMILLNHYLINEKNIDIRLPHAWYRRGDEIVRHYFQPYTKWDHEDLDLTAVSWDGDDPHIDMNDPVAAEIRRYADKYVNRYSGADGPGTEIDALYAKAPYRFQNEYKQFREGLEEVSAAGPYMRDRRRNRLISLFGNAMNAFPDAFSCIEKERSDFESVFRAAAMSGAYVDDLRDMADRFWYFFCYHLRIDKKCHANISGKTLEMWRSSIPWEREMYVRSLQDAAYSLRSEGKEKRIDPILAEREKRVREFSALLEEFRTADETCPVVHGSPVSKPL